MLASMNRIGRHSYFEMFCTGQKAASRATKPTLLIARIEQWLAGFAEIPHALTQAKQAALREPGMKERCAKLLEHLRGKQLCLDR